VGRTFAGFGSPAVLDRLQEALKTFEGLRAARIQESMMADVERTANSASFEAMRHDVAMFGRDAFDDEPKK
jgi:hypothetical protein